MSTKKIRDVHNAYTKLISYVINVNDFHVVDDQLFTVNDPIPT